MGYEERETERECGVPSGTSTIDRIGPRISICIGKSRHHDYSGAEDLHQHDPDPLTIRGGSGVNQRTEGGRVTVQPPIVGGEGPSTKTGRLGVHGFHRMCDDYQRTRGSLYTSREWSEV